MKTNPLVWVLLLLVLGCGCNKQPATSAAANQTATNIFDQFEAATNGVATGETIEEINAKAEKGNAEAQFKLGVKYFNGEGIPKDLSEAVKWYRKAAEQGYAAAQARLGKCYYNGEGVTMSHSEAAKWYRKVAEQGDADAQCLLGLFYEYGEGVPKDFTEAAKWYRKAAEQNNAKAQCELGLCYAVGRGVAKDEVEAVKWYRKAAEQGNAKAQYELGLLYYNGKGVAQDYAEAAKWYRKAAEQGDADGEWSLGVSYHEGWGVPKNYVEAAKWFRKAAEQGDQMGQMDLGECYEAGEGVPKDYVEAYKWIGLVMAQAKPADYIRLEAISLGVRPLVTLNGTILGLAGASWSPPVRTPLGDVNVKCLSVQSNGAHILIEGENDERFITLGGFAGNNSAIFRGAENHRSWLENQLTAKEIVEAKNWVRTFKSSKPPKSGSSISGNDIVDSSPEASGTGFFITEDGYLITNNHVVKDAAQIRLVTSAGLISAKMVKVDVANDIALLKAEGRFTPLPIAESRAMKLGGAVATVGFPDPVLQGVAPKLAKGEIASLSGASDDPRYFQISVPVQPGNSGGALVDEHGNVVGIVSAKLSARAALAASGSLPENVNYAVKSSLLLNFLESMPDVSAKLKAPVTADRKFEDVVKSAQAAAVLVLVY